ncbi:MAG: N-acetylmuramoyl-L-alanine amidase family protein [Bacteroidales bacterium]
MIALRRVLFVLAVGLCVCAALAAATPAVRAQVAQAANPATLTVLSASGRRTLPITVVAGHDMVSLDDLASAFQLSLREDAVAGAQTVGYKGRTVVLMADQPIVSAGGRLVSLPAAAVKEGRRWLVPVEFASRGLALIYDARIDYRPATRLVVVGDLRVPRVAVRQDVQGNQARVTFDASPKTACTVVQDQNRLLVRFDADALDITLPALAAPGLAEGIRVVEPGNAVAILLGPRFATFRTTTTPPDAPTTHLVVDLLPALPGSGPTTPPPQPGLAPVEPLPPMPAPTVRTIVIDPGHGGTEDGVRGASGTLEKDVTLAIARKLKAMLEARLGVRAMLTRDGDAALSLDDRAALANNNKADVFVSIHANASLRANVKGAEIYSLSSEGYTGAQPGAATDTTLPTFGGGSRDIDVVLWEMAQTKHLAESAALAAAVEEELRARVPMATHPLQQAPLRVLVGANMPAVLVEIGFLTNAEQERALASADFQGLVAQSLFNAIAKFRGSLDQGRPATAQPSRMPETR